MTGNVDEATAEVTSTHLILETNLAQVTFRLEDPFFSTLTLLVAAINALPGWHASLQIDGSAPTNSIVSTAKASVAGLVNSGVIGVGPDWLLTMMLSAASTEIGHAINTYIEEGTYSDVFRGGQKEYAVRHGPVTELLGVYGQPEGAIYLGVSSQVARSTVEVTSTAVILRTTVAGVTTSVSVSLAGHSIATLAVALGGNAYYSSSYTTTLGGLSAVDLLTVGPVAIETSGATLQCWAGSPAIESFDYGSGILYLEAPLPVESRIKIAYKAGYTNVPADVELVVLDLIGAMWDKRPRDMSLQNERMSGYAWTAKEFLMDGEIRRRLAPYISYSI
jgi:hypothetical protein